MKPFCLPRGQRLCMIAVCLFMTQCVLPDYEVAGSGFIDDPEVKQCPGASANLIDDMEDAPSSVCPTEGRDGGWYAFAGATDGAARGSHTLAYGAGRTPDSSALLVNFELADANDFAGVGVAFFADSRAFNASAYSGVRFWMWTEPAMAVDVEFATPSTKGSDHGGACDPASGDCYAYPEVQVPLSGGWQQHVVCFNQVVHSGWGIDGTQEVPGAIVDINWKFETPGVTQFTTAIDDLEFVLLGDASCP